MPSNREAICLLIYSKMMRISKKASGTHVTGKILKNIFQEKLRLYKKFTWTSKIFTGVLEILEKITFYGKFNHLVAHDGVLSMGYITILF